MEQIIFALDIGTTKICAIVGEARQGQLRIIGCGIEPSRGIKKGMIVNPSEASVAIARAVEKAEQTSGYDVSRAFSYPRLWSASPENTSARPIAVVRLP